MKGSTDIMRLIIRTILPAFFGFILFSACESQVTSHGHLIELSALEKVEIGKTSRTEILSLLGKPSFEGAFDTSRLYYNSQKVEKVIAGHPQTIERQLLVLTFDNNDLIESLEVRDESTDQQIVKLDASTPTPGDTVTLIDQIFSNLRRRVDAPK